MSMRHSYKKSRWWNLNKCVKNLLKECLLSDYTIDMKIILFSQFVYEDSMDLIAKLPCVAAKIYRNLYREGSSIGAIDSSLDWSHNFTNMLGYSDATFTELMRLYLTIHRSVFYFIESATSFIIIFSQFIIH